MTIRQTQADFTLIDYLDLRVESTPDEVGFRFLRNGTETLQTLTYRELQARARTLAAKIQRVTQPGDRVLVMLDPNLDFQVAFMACLYAGTVAVPSYPLNIRKKEKDKNASRIFCIVRDCAPALALVSSSEAQDALTETLAFIPEAAEMKTMVGNDVSVTHEDDFDVVPVTADSLAFLQYTSGSTSQPKGVELTHRQVIANQSLSAQKMGVASDSVIVSWLPVYHDMGLSTALFGPLYSGAQVILMSPYSFLMHPSNWLKAIAKYRATISGAPNFAYDLCVSRINERHLEELDLSSWRVAFCGAEPIRATTFDRFAKKFSQSGFDSQSYYPCYGLAESTLLVAGGRRDSAPITIEIDREQLSRGRCVSSIDRESSVTFVSCGSDFGDVDVRIVEPEGFSECSEGMTGEIWVNSPSNGCGYWGRKEESQKTFEAKLSGNNTKSYLRTGDLGCIVEGQLYVTGRLKELIIIHGANIYPQDIERVVETAHPALEENGAAAFSLDVAGQDRLVVVSEMSKSPQSEDEKDAIIRAIRTSVNDELNLRVDLVELVGRRAIPRTSSGKIQRKLLQKRLEQSMREAA